MIEAQLYKMILYDFHGRSDRKLKSYEKYGEYFAPFEIYHVFRIIDQKINTLPIHSSFENLNKSNIDDILIEENNWIKQNIDIFSQIKYSRNSKYLFWNGDITLDLPAHYKFDQLIAARLGCKIQKTLFVPQWSNTIRLYNQSAELFYQPTGPQVEKLLSLDIKEFIYKDVIFHDIFDRIVDKIPKFQKTV